MPQVGATARRTRTVRRDDIEVHETKPVAKLRTTITRSDGTVVLDGDAHVYRTDLST